MTVSKSPYTMSAEEFVRMYHTHIADPAAEECTKNLDADKTYWFFVAGDSPQLHIETAFQTTPQQAKHIHSAYHKHPFIPYTLYGGFKDKSELIEFVLDCTSTPTETVRNLALLAGADELVLMKLTEETKTPQP